ncbi:MAG: DNA replication and repair protein RecF [Candidatus Pacebacteria bacterium]|nr:DNA replication and repair protein RecF [Candidatus Paceibacterota bacterium]
MLLKTLNLKNFRNFTLKELKFGSRMSLVVGRNATGKTNLMEAIWILSRGRSFRGGRDEEMISYQEELSVNSCRLSDEEKLEIVLTRGEVGGIRAPRKQYLVNGVKKRAMDFAGILKTVLFRPEDLEIVIGSPAVRRDYLDSVLELVNREYRRASLSYQKGLRQRNRVLEQIREGRANRSALFFWDRLLIENGQLLNAERAEFIRFVNAQPDYFGDLEIEYDQSLISPERLTRYATEEVFAAKTLVGPHRDDFKINSKLEIKNDKFKSRDLSIYGSRGEQRLAVFSLKLAELEFVAKITGQRPVLLLDDIFSELDQKNRRHLLEVIPKQQTIMTMTEASLVNPEFLKGIEIIGLD